MSEHERHIQNLFTAELQFRLASAVRLATTKGHQPLDLPQMWSHGKHLVGYEEVALRPDQADFAACYLHRSATFLMAVAMKDAIKAVVPEPKNSTDSDVRAAYQISRLVRNAFTHAPFSPRWSVDADCRDQIFSVSDIISLNTAGLDGKVFDWRQYGGPLALFRLCRFVRFQILKDESTPRKEVPIPEKLIYQQGSLILTAVGKIPADARSVKVEKLPDGGIPLPGGHVIYTKSKI